MTRRVYLYFIITFVLGIILGGVGTYYFMWHTGRLEHHSGFNKDRALDHLKKALDLSDAQTQQVSQIFDEFSKKLKDLQEQTDPEFEAIRQETRASIRKILNPDQAKRFEEFVRQIDERRRQRAPILPPPR